MKFYQIVSIKIKPNGEAGDEHLQWQGFDYKQALNQKKSAIIGYNSLNVYDKERTKIEPRVYDLEFLKNPSEDEILDALIDSLGYDLF